MLAKPMINALCPALTGIIHHKAMFVIVNAKMICYGKEEGSMKKIRKWVGNDIK